MMVKSGGEHLGSHILGPDLPPRTNALATIFGADYSIASRRVLAQPEPTRRERGHTYAYHSPLDLDHIPGVHFYDGAEFDRELMEMLPVREGNIRALRLAVNLSEEKVGEFLGLGQKGYQKIESGATRTTSLARIALLALLFKQSPLEIALNEEDGMRAMDVLGKIAVEPEVLDQVRARTRQSSRSDYSHKQIDHSVFSNSPLDLDHIPGVHFYEGAEFDRELMEMLPVRKGNIRALRQAMNLSKGTVGKFLGFRKGVGGYRAIESGATRTTSLARIALLALLFKQSPLEIALNEEDGMRAMGVLEKVAVEPEVLDQVRARTRQSSRYLKPQ